MFDNKDRKRKLRLEDIPDDQPQPQPLPPVEYTDPRNGNYHKFKLYEQPKGQHPFQGDYIKFKTRFKGGSNKTDPPKPLEGIYYWENGERYFHRQKAVYQLWSHWKEGYYNFYWIGGKNDVRYFLKRVWIEKVT